jgi:hypothetical protein
MTQTITPSEHETAIQTREARAPEGPPPPKTGSTLKWVAVAAGGALAAAAVGLAITVFTGSGDGADRPTAVEAPVAIGSDRHLENQADAVAERIRAQHLDNEADARAASAAQVENRAPSVAPDNQAALRHNAEQYVEQLEDRAASVASPDNEAALRHNAEQYVEQLEDRAASVAPDEFLPGSRRVPTR